jgi:hypothetical protein
MTFARRSQHRGKGFSKPRKRLRARRYRSIKTRAGLKARRDQLFSIFIRLRDGACVLCGSTSNLECSHYHGRSNPESRVDPLNAHAMCSFHNQQHNSDRKPYRLFIIRTYGRRALTELNQRMQEHVKQSDEEIKEEIAVYESLIEILKADRAAAA